jgi:hypothetical protein
MRKQRSQHRQQALIPLPLEPLLQEQRQQVEKEILVLSLIRQQRQFAKQIPQQAVAERQQRMVLPEPQVLPQLQAPLVMSLVLVVLVLLVLLLGLETAVLVVGPRVLVALGLLVPVILAVLLVLVAVQEPMVLQEPSVQQEPHPVAADQAAKPAVQQIEQGAVVLLVVSSLLGI